MTERQITLMQDFNINVLCCTPSYALTIAERAEELKVDIKPCRCVSAFSAPNPGPSRMRQEIEDRMGIKAMEAFGLTELGGPGVAFDCEAQDGLHINEDHYLAEVVDPETLEPLPLGEKGELIFTSLQRRAMPMIRYRTKDITRLRREKCACGRTLLKMDKVFGRTDDMLIISGVNVFPSQIESLLLEIDEVEPQYRLVVRKKGYLDQLTVRVEAKRKSTKPVRKSRAKSKGKSWATSKATWASASRSTWWSPSSLHAAKAKPTDYRRTTQRSYADKFRFVDQLLNNCNIHRNEEFFEGRYRT